MLKVKKIKLKTNFKLKNIIRDNKKSNFLIKIGQSI